ncbi:MAG: hypothetical protein QM497_03725 [Sulfurimonas sp.]
MTLWKSTLLYTASLLIISGCAGTNPSPTEEIVVDSTLPVITLTDNGVFTDMQAIAFEWKSVKDPRVKGIYIYKTTADKDGVKGELEYYKTIESRFKTHYTDEDIMPNTDYSYAFKTFSKDAEGKSSAIIDVKSLPVLESVSWIYSQTGMPRAAKIIWRPHVNQSVKAYILERKTLEDEKWETLDTVNGRLNAEYIDSELKDNYVYEYRVRVKTYAGIISAPSQIVKVITKALPTSVANIKTSVDLPKAIHVTWEATKVKDFKIYNVYRAESIDGNYKLVATLYNPVFDDNKIEEDGKSYFYQIAVVDKDGLESQHIKISIQGMSLPKPAAPAVINADIVGHTAEIVWSKIDPRTVSYTVVKKFKKGWFDESVEEFTNITRKKFVDSNLEDSTSYSYVVYAVDKHGLKSNPSIAIKFETKESDKAIDAPKTEPKKEVNVSDATAISEDTEIILPVSDLEVNEN